jgi:hypothetical protein
MHTCMDDQSGIFSEQPEVRLRRVLVTRGLAELMPEELRGDTFRKFVVRGQPLSE